MTSSKDDSRKFSNDSCGGMRRTVYSRNPVHSMMAAFIGSAIVAVFLISFLAAPAAAGSDMELNKLWNEVTTAQGKGLPKTAIEHLDRIIPLAMNKGDLPMGLRALCKKIVLEANIQGNKPEEKVSRMVGLVAEAPDRLKPMMKLVLANWYWHYYQQNRWRFSNRSETQGVSDTDFTTWDLPRLFDHIDGIYDEVFVSTDDLKAAATSEMAGFLVEGEAPASYRPTLFDFAAFTAISFYESGDQIVKKPEDAFEIPADSAAFGTPAEFVAYAPVTTDLKSPKLKALKLYQELISFHMKNAAGKRQDALADADLNRLIFVKAHSFGEMVSDRYVAGMKRISEEHEASPVSAMACYRWAEELNNLGKSTEAHEVAARGAAMHPGTAGSNNCRALIASIESKALELATEYSVTPNMGDINITYRNINRVSFRIVREKWDRFLKERWQWRSPMDFNSGWDETLDRVLSERPVMTWTVPLKPTADYKDRTEKIDMPSLEPGLYWIVASWKDGFERGGNAIRLSTMWVTKISMVTRQREGQTEGFVLDAESGAPIEGAKVRFFETDRNGYPMEGPSVKTDADGFYRISKNGDRSFHLLASHGDYMVMPKEGFYPGHSSSDSSFNKALIFTDRALYRPGQMIHFKVLAIKADQGSDTYDFIPNFKFNLVLRDHNYQEVERLPLTTNAFGSASGTFTAPSGKLTGSMTLVCENISGSATVRVEEYKRPKFKVALEAPKGEVKLDQDVEVPGTATAYTGAPVDDAIVKFRVVREVRYPWWWCWWGRPSRESSMEIIHGTVRTDTEGKFTVPFVARPDRSVPRADEPTFHFRVYADVTDSTGETRSSETFVAVGYRSMDVVVEAPSWITAGQAFELGVSANTLSGSPVTAKGILSIHEAMQPARPVRPSLFGESGPSVSDWKTWETGRKVSSHEFDTEGGRAGMSLTLQAGVYKAVAISKDKDGVEVKSVFPFMVLDPKSTCLEAAVPFIFENKSASVKVGETWEALWGTGYETGRAFIEIEHRGRLLKRYWTPAASTQHLMTWAAAREHRGGFHVHVTMVRDNRAYLVTRRIDVPWTDKKLEIKAETFRDKLAPGGRETWTFSVMGPDADRMAAEMVAAMYDASLDAFYPHSWPGLGDVFRSDSSTVRALFSNSPVNAIHAESGWNDHVSIYFPGYWHFPYDILNDFCIYAFPYDDGFGGGRGMVMRKSRGMKFKDFDEGESLASVPSPSMAPGGKMEMQKENKMMAEAASDEALDSATGGAVPEKDKSGAGAGGASKPDLSKVSARTNLNETAFFQPSLVTDADGVVKVTFEVPEALTEWNVFAFAHAGGLKNGMLRKTTVTQKDLMVQPNAPRFLREGDVLEFTVKVTNMSSSDLSGIARLNLRDGLTDKPLDALFGIGSTDQDFTIGAKRSASLSWKLTVPDFTGTVIYKAVAAAGDLSDGEENFLPVLSKRIFVTESIPLPIRGPGEKKFTFRKLLESGGSDTLVHKALTLQMVSNPSWYAVQALPYLMEYPHECSEQIFNRLYANTLAKFIANSNPKIRRIFDAWKGTDALKSNLEKNQELKSVLLEETPWVIDAQNEGAAKRRVGLLFDANHMEDALGRAVEKLKAMQLSDGSWPWFPGGRSNFYITLYVMTGFGRLRHLGVDSDFSMAFACLDYLDGEMDRRYRELKRHGHLDRNNLSTDTAMYLYGRSFFIDSKGINDRYSESAKYWRAQAAEHWLKVGNRLSQGHIALACHRFGDPATAKDIVASLKERSVNEEEMGMYWRELELSWWWYRAPIETQAVMIEVFDEIPRDENAVEDMKVWLIKQKQTQDWKTTKATADAIYALLLRGENLLASDEIVRVTLGGIEIKPEKVEAGTGFYEKKFVEEAVKPEYGAITVKKVDKGVAWGSLHWQYMEEMSKVTPHETPLKLEKSLFVTRETQRGPVIEPVKGSLAVGDLVKVRIVLRTDRDMEFVHMKDYRGSGTEPTNVLSGYKYQDGLAYYEATRDTATNFFIDYLPKGTYVFEYSLRIQHKGRYQMGMATIQCMYAPEFNSHSGSEFIEVK